MTNSEYEAVIEAIKADNDELGKNNLKLAAELDESKKTIAIMRDAFNEIEHIATRNQ